MSSEAARVIPVTSGVGFGPTPLSAFDHALFEAGIANYNLIPLSSVIPLGHQPRVERVDWNGQEQGHRLYVVLASQQAETKGQSVAAGLGWVMAKTNPVWGLFVEHHGETEEDVRRQIENSLAHMMSYRTDCQWGKIETHIVSAKCSGTPVCALAAAIYQSEPWG